MTGSKNHEPLQILKENIVMVELGFGVHNRDRLR